MAFVTMVGGKSKRIKGRFGGELAHRERGDKATACNARRRADKQFFSFVLQELNFDEQPALEQYVRKQSAIVIADLDSESAQDYSDIYSYTGEIRPVDGVIREDDLLSLGYCQGRLVSAHCG